MKCWLLWFNEQNVVSLGYIHVGEIALKWNNLITKIPVLGKKFRISFEVWLDKIDVGGWQSIIHFTNDGDYPRLPAIYIAPNYRCLIQFQLKQKLCNTSRDFGEKIWTNLEISQQLIQQKVGRGNIGQYRAYNFSQRQT